MPRDYVEVCMEKKILDLLVNTKVKVFFCSEGRNNVL